MFAPLRIRLYQRLFLAQVLSLTGTGLATVALALLAYDLAGERAGVVLGTALAIKMIAYVGIAPIAGAFADRAPRRALLVTLDGIRAGIALALPFVTEVWQIYVLIFLLQSASAAFTPTFQATIPDILKNEDEYSQALSLSRLAYDLESVLSPMLAAVLLGVLGYHQLFGGTAIGFVLSGLLVLSVALPAAPRHAEPQSVYRRMTRGLRIFWRTPRLRGVIALNLTVSAAGAMVIVNTVVLVNEMFTRGEQAMALALGLFGAGSMAGALLLPRLMRVIHGRSAMLAGAALLSLCLVAGMMLASYSGLLVLWTLMGFGAALAQTPIGLLMKRSAHPEDRPAVFSAQFALSHACWLITYPLAGWMGAQFGLSLAFGGLAVLAALGLALTWWIWPRRDLSALTHDHINLDRDDPHLAQAEETAEGFRHCHTYVIDNRHPIWPR